MKLYLKRQPYQAATEPAVANPGVANMDFPVIASPVFTQATTPDSASDVLQPVKKLYLKKQPSQVKTKPVITNPGASGETSTRTASPSVKLSPAQAFQIENALTSGRVMPPTSANYAADDAAIGRYGKGNIDLYHRPQYRYEDGSIATVRSMGFNENGQEILIPTIAFDNAGKAVELTDEQAIDRYHKTGEYLGKFKTVEESNAYAERLHRAQDYYYNGRGAKSLDAVRDTSAPSVSKTAKTAHDLTGGVNHKVAVDFPAAVGNYVTAVRNTSAARGIYQALQAEQSGKTDNTRYGQYLSLMTPEEREKATRSEINGGLSEEERGAYIRSLNLDERIRERNEAGREKFIETIEANIGFAKASKDAAGERYAKWAAGKDVISGRGEVVPVPGEFRVLTQKQKDTFKAYADAGDFKAVANYYNALEPSLSAKYAESQKEAFRGLTENSTAAAIASVPISGALNAFGGIPGYVATAGQVLKDAATGDYNPIDKNSEWYQIPRITQAMDEGRSKRIDDKIENPTIRFIAKTASSGISSGLSNLIQLATGTAFGLEGNALAEFVTATMSASAGGQAAYRNLEEGQTNGDAFLNATASAAIEYWTEHMTTSRWIENLGKIKSGRFSKADIAKMIATQTGAEMWEEVVGNVADQTWDRTWNGENSEFAKRTRDLMDSVGLSRADAEMQAFKELYVDQSVEAALSVAFSMILMDGVPAISNHVSFAETGQTLRKSGGAETVDNEIAKGLLFPDSPAYKQAVKVRDKWDGGKGRVNDRELGRLSFLNAQEEMELVSDLGDNGTASQYVVRSMLESTRNNPMDKLSVDSIRMLQNMREATSLTPEEQRIQNRQYREFRRDFLRQIENIDLDAAGNPLVSYTEAVREIRARLPNATSEQIRQIYSQYRDDTRTVLFGGHRLTRAQFRSLMQEATPEKLSGVDLDRLFNTAILDTLDGSDAYERYLPGVTERNFSLDENGAPAESSENAPQSAKTANTAADNVPLETPIDEGMATQEDDLPFYWSDETRQAPEPVSDTDATTMTPGLVRDEYTQQSLSLPEFARIDTTARLLGVSVRFVDSIQAGTGEANGLYRNGAVLIERGNENPVLKILGHEWTHHIQRTAPEAYERFKASIADDIRDSAEVIREEYGKAGITLTESESMDEAAANYAGKLMSDGILADSFIDRHIRERSLLEKVRDAIADTLERLRRSIVNLGRRVQAAATSEDARQAYREARQQEQRAREILDRFNAALDAAAQNVREDAMQTDSAATQDNGDIRFAIKTTDSGEKYVRADRQVIFGNNPRSWGEQVENYINGKIRRGQDVLLMTDDGDALLLTKTTAGKLSSRYRGNGTSLSENEYMTKLEAGVHIDELARISQSTHMTADKNSRHGDFASKGWSYRRAFFQDSDGVYYSLDISVAQNDTGNIVYNIGNVKRRNFPTARNASNGSSADSGAQGGETSSANNIPQTAAESKENFSLKGTEDTEIAELQGRLEKLNQRDAELSARQDELNSSQEYQNLSAALTEARKKSPSRFNPSAEVKAAQKALSQWRETSGYQDISNERKSLSDEIYSLQKTIRTKTEQAAESAKAAYRKMFTPEVASHYAEKAAQAFGTTDSFERAGYLTVDGQLLDFSRDQKGRAKDHREISDVLDFLPDNHGQSDGLTAFESMGNIRLQSGGIELVRAPTAAQVKELRRFFRSRNGQVVVDFAEEDGSYIGSLNYEQGTSADRILRNIDAYFETGNIPNQSLVSQFHYSLKGTEDAEDIAALRRENNYLTQRLDEVLRQRDNLRRQLSRSNSQNAVIPQIEAERVARQIIRDYYSDIDPKELGAALKEASEFMIRTDESGTSTRDVQGKLQYAQDKLMPLVEEMLESAWARDTDADAEEWEDIKSRLHNTRLTISLSDSHDIPDYGAWRQSNMGRLNIGIDRANSTPVDVFYHEMSEQYPTYFPADITAASDQLLHMAGLWEDFAPIWDNPFQQYLNDMNFKLYVVNDMLTRMVELEERAVRPTWADRQAEAVRQTQEQARERVSRVRNEKNAAMEKQRQEMRAQYQKSVSRVRREKDAKIESVRQEGIHRARQAVEEGRRQRQEAVDRLKAQYREKSLNWALRKYDSAERQRLLKVAQRLSKMKADAVTRATISSIIGNLDTVSVTLTGQSLDELVNLRRFYQDRSDKNSPRYDPDFIPDAATEKRLERLERRQISDLTLDEVRDLTNVLLNLEHELRTNKSLLARDERIDIYQAGNQTIRDIEATEGVKGDFLSQQIDRKFITQTLSPIREIRRMVGYRDNNPLLQRAYALDDGQRAMLDYQMRAEAPFRKFAEDKVFRSRFSGKDAETIEITATMKTGERDGHSIYEDVTVKITPAMRVAIYCLSQDNDGLRHMRDGGLTIPDMTLYRKGNLDEAYNQGVTVKLTPSQARKAVAGMTVQDSHFANLIHAYYNGQSRNEINRTSEILKGYSIAGNENYYPIHVDRNFLKVDFESLKHDGTIEGMGFLKDREARASQPIMLRDADAELEQSIRMHSRYVGLAIPVRDFMKIWNVTTWGVDASGNHVSYENSVKQAVKRKWGEPGFKYVEKLMTDLNTGGGHEDSEWGRLFGKLRSNYAGAVLTLNVGVALKQAASYPTAAAVLGTKPLMMAMKDFGSVDLNLIAKYTPLQWYRSLGYSTRELGDMARHDKSLPALLNWVQGVDLLTTRKLWKASEYYVRLNQKTLKQGTESYYKAVADIYNRVIEETQPNYTTMQRPQMLRSDDIFSQAFGIFKTQPFQNFNILYDSYKNLRSKQNQAKAGIATEADVKTASRDFGRAVYSQLMQLAVFAAMTIGWAKWRDRDEKYRDENGELHLLRGWALEMCGGLLSDVPGGSDLWEFASSKLFGQKYYGMEVTVTQMMSDTVTSLDKLWSTLSDAAGKLVSGEKADVKGVIRQVHSSVGDITKLFGVPYQNGMNLFLDTRRNLMKLFLNPVEVDYDLTQWAADPKKAAYDHLFQTGGRKFYLNPESESVTESYRALYRQMIQDGFEESDIQSKMKDRWTKTDAYQKSKSQYVGLLTGTILASPAYARLDEAHQKEVSEDIQAAAKYEMFRDYVDGYQGNSQEKWIEEALALNSEYQIPLPDLIVLYAGKNGITSITTRDRKGNEVAIDNSKGLQIMEMAYLLFPEMEKWDSKKRQAVLEWLGVGKTLLRYNSGIVSAKLERMRRDSSPGS